MKFANRGDGCAGSLRTLDVALQGGEGGWMPILIFRKITHFGCQLIIYVTCEITYQSHQLNGVQK